MESPLHATPRRYDLGCQVDPYRDGWTVLRFLTHRFRYHPEDLWSDRLAEGVVRVRGETATVDTIVRKGDRVEYTFYHTEPTVDFAYQVLFEDEHLLAVAKSGNLPVHAGGKFIRNTLIAKLREKWGDELRLAHRLDRETSGVVLLAKSAATARHLEVQFRERRVGKQYWAILRGTTPDSWTVDAAIARREPAAPPYFRVVDESSGKQAVTRFRRLATATATGTAPADSTATATAPAASGPVSLVEVEPTSGRTNQIRVHAAHVGYAILGDKIYGVPEEMAAAFVRDGETPELLAAAGAARHLLHCSRLSLEHPGSGQSWNCSAPAPDDFGTLFPDWIQSQG